MQNNIFLGIFDEDIKFLMKRVSQTTHRNLEYIGWSRDSSVGRAGD